jgi:hypothetical protein
MLIRLYGVFAMFALYCLYFYAKEGEKTLAYKVKNIHCQYVYICYQLFHNIIEGKQLFPHHPVDFTAF